MYSLRIQKGRFRGKSIHPPVPVRGISNATPSLLKEAIFQILDVRLNSDRSEWSFFDLCAGSGQMAFEALSLGYGEVHICEIEKERFASILKDVKHNNFSVILHRKDFIRLVPLIVQKEKSVLFLDVPYSHWIKGKSNSVDDFLKSLDRALGEIGRDGIKSSGILCIQAEEEYFPSSDLKSFSKFLSRSYGGNFVTFLTFNS